MQGPVRLTQKARLKQGFVAYLPHIDASKKVTNKVSPSKATSEAGNLPEVLNSIQLANHGDISCVHQSLPWITMAIETER